jgi:hypothetical protein
MMDNKLSVEGQIAIAILNLSEEPEEKMISIKLEALKKLRAIIYQYMNRGFLKDLVLTICEKKIVFIHQARTKKDIEEILGLSKVRFNGREVVPVGKYHIPEEELLLWSMISPAAPLKDYAVKRYEKLFRELLPEQADILNL